MRTPQSPHYKHYIGITSQISFCQVPLRLDSFNKCAFFCSYCFAKSRGGYRGTGALQVTRAVNLADRFRRIRNGGVASAVDEFLNRGIPIQLGGMTDPFSSFEQKRDTTHELMRVLANEQYPTLISTKGTILGDDKYVEILGSGNFLVRFSISVIGPSNKNEVERGVAEPTSVFRLVEFLSGRTINRAIRLQPVIPGHEQFAFALVRNACEAGARHITIEYLKLPLDDLNSKICKMKTGRGESLIEFYRRSGATQQGRELVLPARHKATFLSEISKFAREKQLSVGFGDNEFLPYSDGRSCCNGADLYLRNYNLFEANPASVIRRKRGGDSIEFGELTREWMPRSRINTYLNSRVRVSPEHDACQWHSYLKAHWRVGSIYSPDFFHGVQATGRYDTEGLPIFVSSRDQL